MTIYLLAIETFSLFLMDIDSVLEFIWTLTKVLFGFSPLLIIALIFVINHGVKDIPQEEARKKKDDDLSKDID